MTQILDRLLKYVSFDTQSCEESESQPSTAKQLKLLGLLRDELQALGAEAVLDEYGYAGYVSIDLGMLHAIDYYTGIDAEIVDLCTAMLTYGAYSQTWFGYNTSSLANANYSADISGVTAADVANYGTSWVDTDPGDGIAYAGQVFSCQSNTVMRYYFTAPSGVSASDFTAAFANGGTGMEFDIAVSGNYVIVSVSGVAAAQLVEEMEIELSFNSAVVGTFSAYPMAYAKTNLNNPNAQQNLVNLCKAIYLYGTAAGAFFA